ncbi:MAG: methyltransferase domain-containing protein [Ignavibacteria bacterium]|nr:methyltransferase domain-containing protein [Ignavibacteria bacterium]
MKDNSSSVSDSEFWDEKYRNNLDNWELSHPTKVFADLQQTQWLKSKGSILVLGCGSGHDAILFAENGFEVYANDFSSEAILRAKKNAQMKNVKVEFLNQDLFTLNKKFGERFDYVLEYTTFCAIDPKRRVEYRDLVFEVLRQGGLFVALFFPLINKAEHTPPFTVDALETYKMFSEKFNLKYSERPISSVKPRLNNELLMIWEK